MRGLLDELTEAYSRLVRRVDVGAIRTEHGSPPLGTVQGTLNGLIEATYRLKANRLRGDGRLLSARHASSKRSTGSS